MKLTSVILSGSNIDTQEVVKFINKHYVQENGNLTLVSEEILGKFTKLGTICSQLTEGQDITGIVLSVLLTLNIGKSSYTTYLCVHSDYRRNKYAAKLVESNICFGSKLGVKHGYYLGTVSRRMGCLINSWYRILDVDRMMVSGFDMLTDKRKARIKYNIRTPKGLSVVEGMYANVKDKSRSIYWDPDPKELNRYVANLDWYTIMSNDEPIAVFALFPLDCVIGDTKKTVKTGMLVYYYSFGGHDLNNIKMVFQTAKEKGYECLYGYILGGITPEIANDSGCHITDAQFYLDFYNHPKEIVSAADINVPIF